MDKEPASEPLAPNEVTRFIYDGADVTRACRIRSYEFIDCSECANAAPMSSSTTSWQCAIHGRPCIGHLERSSRTGCLMMPSSLIPGTREVTNRYQTCKERLERGNIDEEDYKLMTSKMMMGKSGCVRSLNSARVEGSIRMVISVGSAESPREVVIPEAVASRTQVPYVVDAKVRYTRVKDGDWGLLVRQPCLWSGGIQPVVVRVSNEHIMRDDEGNQWNVNWSMKIPPQLCSPYAADFDGDEMSLFVVKRPGSVRECESFSWDYDGFMSQEISSQVLPRSYGAGPSQAQITPSHRFKLTMMATTVCWSDMWRRSSEAPFKLSEAHMMSGLSTSSFIKFRRPHSSALDFASKALQNVAIACSKSSLQSDVGALSRRSKLGAERVMLLKSGCYARLSSTVDMPISDVAVYLTPEPRYHFGNPCVRAVSKLASRVMQITLKVKSTDSVESISPTMTLLSGSLSWPVVTRVGTVEIVNEATANRVEVQATCSIWHISSMDPRLVQPLCRSAVIMCLAETRVRLDPSEFSAIVQLCIVCCESVKSPSEGLEIKTFGTYPGLPCLWLWNSCFFSTAARKVTRFPRVPGSLVERLFICNFRSLAGILDYQP